MKIAPSILSADFSKLGEEIKDIDKSGADYVHIDVMDGYFVPNISFGSLIIEAIRPLTNLTFDVHLMVEQPERYIEQIANSGADIITIHQEATRHLHRALQQIKSLGKKAGVVLNPGTPVGTIVNVLDLCDMVLIMTVNPGFGNQAFIETTISKIKELVALREKYNYSYEIEVDGGINDNTAIKAIEAGADVLVAGSYVFGNVDRAQAIESLRRNR